MPKPTKAVALYRLPDRERDAAEKEITDELKWCDDEGTRFDVMLSRDLLPEEELNFVWDYPPLDELGLEDVPWPSKRFSMRSMGSASGPVIDTFYFHVSGPASPFVHNMSQEPCTQMIRFAVRNHAQDVIGGSRLPGLAYAEFIRGVDGSWKHFQFVFDESLETNKSERLALYRIMLTNLYLILKVLRSPEFKPERPAPAPPAD